VIAVTNNRYLVVGILLAAASATANAGPSEVAGPAASTASPVAIKVEAAAKRGVQKAARAVKHGASVAAGPSARPPQSLACRLGRIQGGRCAEAAPLCPISRPAIVQPERHRASATSRVGIAVADLEEPSSV
jgi:hypothetical protein